MRNQEATGLDQLFSPRLEWIPPRRLDVEHGYMNGHFP